MGVEKQQLEQVRTGDIATVSAAREVLQGSSSRRGFARVLPFMGPAFIASIAYMDPGNFATNITGGAQYGYMLLWVIVASNLMAMLIQTLSAKLGIATGMNLAEACREHFPQPLVVFMWVVSEVVAMATHLAELVGAALGFKLLFNVDLLPAAIVTGITTFIILGLERRGFRPLEAVITGMVGVIAACYLIETILDNPDWGLIAIHAVTPQFAGASKGGIDQSILLAVGILGATVMPHVIFLHSALTQNRIIVGDEHQQRRLFRFTQIDVLVAMGLSGIINAAMLIMPASTFFKNGFSIISACQDVITEAYKTLVPLL